MLATTVIDVSISSTRANLIGLAYLFAIILFIVGLKRLTHPNTARQGNQIAGVGMLIAVVATLFLERIVTYEWILIGAAFGAPIGYFSAKKVKMTSMPEMVALFNGVGGGAVALIALSEYYAWTHHPFEGSLITNDVEIASLFSLIIGSISFWGSVVAFLKLSERIDGKPKSLPGQQLINATLGLIAIGLSVYMLAYTGMQPYWIAVAIAGIAAILGLFFVLPIGGADMPRAMCTLHGRTGLDNKEAGFPLHNNALDVAGMIVGASGTILTNLMAVAMNRTIGGVLFGSFGASSGGSGTASSSAGETGGTVQSTDAASAAILMAYAQSVIVVPGYGLAVAQAQHTIKEMADQLEAKGVSVKYAIHPVAGRMPGHMNVLLAESDVPYDQLVEMDDINPEFERTDVAIVVGANDVVNPEAKNSKE